MKKIIVNLSDSLYEKFRLEALNEKKSIQHVIENRLRFKPFDKDVEEAFSNWMDKEFYKIINEKIAKE